MFYTQCTNLTKHRCCTSFKLMSKRLREILPGKKMGNVLRVSVIGGIYLQRDSSGNWKQGNFHSGITVFSLLNWRVGRLQFFVISNVERFWKHENIAPTESLYFLVIATLRQVFTILTKLLILTFTFVKTTGSEKPIEVRKSLNWLGRNLSVG